MYKAAENMMNYKVREGADYGNVAPSAIGSAGLSAMLSGISTGDPNDMIVPAVAGGVTGGGISALLSTISGNRQHDVLQNEENGKVYTTTDSISPEKIEEMKQNGTLSDVDESFMSNADGSILHSKEDGKTFIHAPHILPEEFEKWKTNGVAEKVSK